MAKLNGLPKNSDGLVLGFNKDWLMWEFGKAGIKGMRFHDLRHESTDPCFEPRSGSHTHQAKSPTSVVGLFAL